MIKTFALILSGILFCASSQAQEILIGLANVMSEPGSDATVPQGDFFRNGVKLAFEENAAALRKKGLNVRFIDFDYRANGVDVIRAAKEIAKTKVVAVIGYNYSDHVFLAAKYHEDAGIPLITPYGTANRIGELSRFVFQTPYSNAFQARLLADEIKRRTHCAKTVVVAASNCGYCQDLSRSFNEFYSKQKCETVTLEVLAEDEEFSGLIEKIRQLKLEKAPVFVPNMEIVSGKIVIALSKAGIRGPFFGGDGWTDFGYRFFSKAVHQANVEAYSATHWTEEVRVPENKRFVQAYQKFTGKKPHASAAMAYDSGTFLATALLNCTSYDSRSVQSCLDKTRIVQGALGPFYFPEGRRSPIKSGVLMKLQPSGQFTLDRILPAEGKK